MEGGLRDEGAVQGILLKLTKKLQRVGSISWRQKAVKHVHRFAFVWQNHEIKKKHSFIF